MQQRITINSLSESAVLNNETPLGILSAVPSTLMKTPSEEFPKALKFIAGDGFYTIDILKNQDNNNILEITNIKGFVDSQVGRHFIQLLEPSKITVDVATLDNAQYNIFLSINFKPNNPLAGDFPLDELVVEIVTGDSFADFSEKIGEITVQDGVIDGEPTKTAEQLTLTNQASSMIVQDYNNNVRDNVQQSLENMEDFYKSNKAEQKDIIVRSGYNAVLVNPITFDSLTVEDGATLKFI